jgi:hypothetical protein
MNHNFQAPIQWVPGGLSPGVKRQAREAPRSSAKVNSGGDVRGIYLHLPLCLHGMVHN